MTANHNPPKYGRCPNCTSAWIIPSYGQWICKSCKTTFDRPTNASPLSKAKTKPQNITPLTYRQQITREILAANAQARERIDGRVKANYYGQKK